MRRREFILGTGLVATSALAGCTGNKSPPPRKSNVFEEIRTTNGKLDIQLEDNTWVQSRYEAEDRQNDLGNADTLGDLSPVGGARAKGKGGAGGRGATGRADGGYSNAPKTHHGRAWLYGGAYANSWYDDHDDEVSKYGVTVSTIGVAYLGSSFEMDDDAPGPGPVPWDCRIESPDDEVTCDMQDDGWYRVGAEIRGPDGHDFDWESVDLEVDDTLGSEDEYEVEKEWKVSPRI